MQPNRKVSNCFPATTRYLAQCCAAASHTANVPMSRMLPMLALMKMNNGKVGH